MDITHIILIIIFGMFIYGGIWYLVSAKAYSLLSPICVIPFFGFFYLSGWIFHKEKIGGEVSFNETLLLGTALIFLLVFMIGGSLNLKLPVTARRDLNLQSVFLTGFLVYSISLFLFIVIFLQFGGEYFFISKGARNLLSRTMGFEKFAKDIMVSGIILLSYYFCRVRRVTSPMFVAVFLTSIFFFIVLENRSALAIVLLTSLYFFHQYVKAIKNWNLVVVYGSLLFLGSIAKEIFYGLRVYVAEGWFAPQVGQALTSALSQHEFYSWLEIFKNLQYSFVYGETFVKSLKSFVMPGFLGGESYSAAQWYVDTFLPEVAEVGNGRAFSMIVELYINFTVIGLWLVGFTAGVVINHLERKQVFLLTAFITSTFPFIWTGNSAVLLKQYFAIYFLPAFLIYTTLQLLPRKVRL
ncbi:MAG: hypothetical protein AB3N18_14560 [Allomuricauda sp.]